VSDDFFTRKTYRHRIEVDGTKFIVETWIKGDLRIIQNAWHCRRHRRGGTADVRIHPNGRRPPSATLAKLWDHLGVSHDALWKECPANHPSFSKQRAIQTAFDVAEESTMHKAATDALLAQGWIWNVEALRWDAPPAQAVDPGLQLDRYDAGLLGDGGGGDVGWWQDYIRTELDRAHEFYQDQADSQAVGNG
jgi:hypothetical protein